MYQVKLKFRKIQSIEKCFANSDQVPGSWEEQPVENIEYSTFGTTLRQFLGL